MWPAVGAGLGPGGLPAAVLLGGGGALPPPQPAVLSVHDRTVFVENSEAPPPGYVLARRWARSDLDADVEGLPAQPSGVALPRPRPAPEGSPPRPAPFPDDSQDYDPEESVFLLKCHWEAVRRHDTAARAARVGRFDERLAQLLGGAAARAGAAAQGPQQPGPPQQALQLQALQQQEPQQQALLEVKQEPQEAPAGALQPAAAEVAASQTAPAYGDASYWDARYAREPTCFDWYQTWEGLAPVLNAHFKQRDRLLHIGVGTSQLQADMVREGGYACIVNTDISAVAVAQMQALHSALPQLTYRVSDARSMPEFDDASFDGLLDKGTLDAVLCGPDAGANAAAVLEECARVLRPGGTLLVITYGDPSSRLPLLQQPSLGWAVSLYVLGKHADTGPALGPQLSPIIQGPIDTSTLGSLDRLAILDGVHYVYVCSKPAQA
ncbi:EEF1AKMT4 [Scenedesmus sp. PABB004]|nr:EEF1AKMT4 [Scenedesmus sp. PABB004]